jgi:hypothetical protein
VIEISPLATVAPAALGAGIFIGLILGGFFYDFRSRQRMRLIKERHEADTARIEAETAKRAAEINIRTLEIRLQHVDARLTRIRKHASEIADELNRCVAKS